MVVYTKIQEVHFSRLKIVAISMAHDVVCVRCDPSILGAWCISLKVKRYRQAAVVYICCCCGGDDVWFGLCSMTNIDLHNSQQFDIKVQSGSPRDDATGASVSVG